VLSSIVIPILVIAGALLLAWPLGRYMKWVMDPVAISGWRSRLERVFRLFSCGEGCLEQTWKPYCRSLLISNFVMFLVVYLILTIQGYLPLNPDGKTQIEPDLAFNTTASFVTNTNLQHYSGEQSMSYFSQLAALMWLQFVSAATGIAAFTALCRGLSGRRHLGNFYVDLWRASTLILLPLSLISAGLLVLSGVPMTFKGAAIATTLEGVTQTIARGPAAAMIAIKQLGTNGGGFFGPNCAHPFENPGFWSNILNNICIILIPMGSVWMFGRITQRMRHAVVIFASMLGLYLVLLVSACLLESAPTPALSGLPVEASANLEGKELRLGGSAGAAWAVTTTVTSNGSVNAMHDSLNPLTGLLPMIGMWLNVVFGGVGVGFINMFIFIVITVFIAGMMVGRTPEYLGRKVESKEVKLALLAMLSHPLFILGGAALFAVTPWGVDTTLNKGSHGLSEIIYEFTSAAANNGSGFEGLGDNTIPWNVVTGIVMLLARYIPIIAPLAIAGILAGKHPVAATSGTFRVDTPLFGGILVGTILLVGALLFLPLGVLGPIAEHLSIH
jgi:potassium-transporting ATPase potassium-binding subunit